MFMQVSSTTSMRAPKNDRKRDLDENFILETEDDARQWLPEYESLAPSPGCRAETYQVWSL
jgi:hypothetical protein